MKKRFVFQIPYPSATKGVGSWPRRYSLNAYYAGKHWTERKRDADYWHALTRANIGKTPPMFDGPVELRFVWDDRLDLSNHAVIAKMIEDALKGRVIIDDSPKYVRRIVHEFSTPDAGDSPDGKKHIFVCVERINRE